MRVSSLVLLLCSTTAFGREALDPAPADDHYMLVLEPAESCAKMLASKHLPAKLRVPVDATVLDAAESARLIVVRPGGDPTISLIGVVKDGRFAGNLVIEPMDPTTGGRAVFYPHRRSYQGAISWRGVATGIIEGADTALPRVRGEIRGPFFLAGTKGGECGRSTNPETWRSHALVHRWSLEPPGTQRVRLP